jgi:hypothetical protein
LQVTDKYDGESRLGQGCQDQQPGWDPRSTPLCSHRSLQSRGRVADALFGGGTGGKGDHRQCGLAGSG